jgi:transitional endoplasmic reticulum ATPase
MVDESPSDDNSVAVMHPNTMEQLGLFRCVIQASFWDRQKLIPSPAVTRSLVRCHRPIACPIETKIVVRGKRRKDTVLICLSQDEVEEGKIAMNKGMP